MSGNQKAPIMTIRRFTITRVDLALLLDVKRDPRLTWRLLGQRYSFDYRTVQPGARKSLLSFLAVPDKQLELPGF